MATYNLLHIEDNPTRAKSLLDILSSITEFRVTVQNAVSLKEGIALLSGSDFDVVLLDLNILESIGKDTYPEFKNYVPNHPVIIIIDQGDEALAVELATLGLADYLVREKLTPQYIAEKIKSAFEHVQIGYFSVPHHAEYMKEQSQQEQQISALNNVFSNSSSLITFLLDSEYKYIAFNEGHKNDMKKRFDADINIGDNILHCINDSETIQFVIKSFSKALEGNPYVVVRYISKIDTYYEYHWENIKSQTNHSIGISCFMINVTQRERNEERLRHFNLVLTIIRKLNRLYNEITDEFQLLEKTAKLLVIDRGYLFSHLALINSNNEIYFDVKMRYDFEQPISEKRIKAAPKIYSDILLSDRPFRPSKVTASASELTVGVADINCDFLCYKINLNENNFGVMIVGLPSYFTDDADEQDLFVELTEELARALNKLKLDSKLIAQQSEIDIHNKRVISQSKILEYNYKSTDDLLLFAIEEAVALTESQEGYVYQYNEQSKKFKLKTATKFSEKERFAESIRTEYELSEIGILGDTVVYRKGVYQNDMEKHREKISTNIWRVRRFLAMPVIEDGQIIAVIGLINKPSNYTDSDLTEIKLLTDTLWKIVQKNRFVEKNLILMRTIESSMNAIVICNIKGTIEYANPMFGEISSLTTDQIIGSSLFNLPKSEFTQDEVFDIIKTIGQNKIWSAERKKLDKNGKELFELVSISPVRDIQDRITHFSTIIQDITSRKKMESALLKSEKEFRTIWESSTEGLRLTDDNGIILRVNQAYCDIFGIDRNSLEGKLFNVVYTDGRGSLSTYKDNFKTRNIKANLLRNVVLRDGKAIWIEVISSFIQLNENEVVLLSIFRDVTVRKQAEEEIINAKEKAEEMNRLKSSFLHNMSHELRTPLIGILGFSEVLLETIHLPEQRKMLSNIQKSGNRLFETLNLVLNLSRIEADKLPITPEYFNVGSAVLETVDLFEGAAIKKSLYLDLHIIDNGVTVNLDKKMFDQCITNLLNNALKFTNSGGVKVTVDSEVTTIDGLATCNAVVKVTDTGIGIRNEDLNLIFDEFRQTSEGFSRAYEGSGLGLAITKKFIQKLGGIISVESEFGSGSTFTMKFPAEYSVKEEDNLSLEIDGANENCNEVFTIGYKYPEKSVLLIDDDSMTFNLLKKIFDDICRLDYSSNASEAISMIVAHKYDLLLIDINLGYAKNGIDVLKEVKLLSEYFDVPTTALTAYAMQEDIDRFYEEGFDYVLPKPFKKADLLKIVSRCFDEF